MTRPTIQQSPLIIRKIFFTTQRSYNNPATNPTIAKTTTATPPTPTLSLVSCAPLTGTTVVATPPVFVELTGVEVPVLLVVIPTAVLIVLFGVAGVDAVLETAAAEVAGFALLVVT